MLTERIVFPLRISLLNHALSLRDPIGLAGIVIITSRPEAIRLLGAQDGILFDKSHDGILKYANQFAGGDRSAFCPRNTDVWKLKATPRSLFGDGRYLDHSEAVRTIVKAELAGQNLDGTQVKTTELSRKLVMKAGCKLFFGVETSDEEIEKVCNAYEFFNNWCALTTLTFGLSDMSRSPRLSTYGLITKAMVENTSERDLLHRTLNTVSALIFGSMQDTFNESLRVIAKFSERVWNASLKEDSEITRKYTRNMEEYNLTEAQIILECTNIIGGIVSSPSSVLGFLLETFSRLDVGDKQRFAEDESFRKSFYLEVSRFFQPLNWVMRDIVQPITINDKKYDAGSFVFVAHKYNRNPKIWGDDANEFVPDRFAKDESLHAQLITYGRGISRCPSGRTGDIIAKTYFEEISHDYDLHHSGKLMIGLKDTIFPTTSIRYTSKQSKAN